MDNILQGTTPTLTISIDPTDFSVSDLTGFELRIGQQSTVTIYSLSDVTIDPVENTVSYLFTEAETLALIPDILLAYQCRFFFADGNICGTDLMYLNVNDLMGSGVSK